MQAAEDRLTVPASEIVQWARAFVRHPSPQTERFEQEPQVQSFVSEAIVPLVNQLGLPCDATAWAISWSSSGPSGPTKA